MLHVATHTNIHNWQLKGTEKFNQMGLMDFELNWKLQVGVVDKADHVPYVSKCKSTTYMMRTM